jgi:hypothetical protein
MVERLRDRFQRGRSGVSDGVDNRYLACNELVGGRFLDAAAE